MESLSWNHYYSIPKRMLSLAGQWPSQGKRARFSRVSLLTAVTFSMVIPQMAQVVHCDGNGRCIMLTVPSIMFTAMILVKLYTCHFNNSKIKSLANYVRDDWEKLENAEECEIMKTYGVNARLWALGYTLYSYAIILLFMSMSLVPQILNVLLPLNETRPIIMPYEAYYFVEGEEYFFYIFLHLSVALNIAMITLVAHDCMFLTFIEHVCSLFAIAGFRLEAVSRNDRNDATGDGLKNDWKTYDRRIAISVRAHWRALRFARLLEDTFCIAFFVQMIIVTVTMSITLLQIAMQLDEVMMTVRYTAYVIGQVIHLFCYSLQGQKLIDHSVQIRDKIYGSSWYEIPVGSQRLLLYVMRRSRESNFLSAGKIYVFSLKSFITVIQSSVSYFTVLSSFQ